MFGILFLFLLVPFASALEMDAALSIIVPDILLTQKEYTKLFKINNKHPSLGDLENVTVFYSVARGEKSIFRDSFTKSVIKRSSSVDTGRLFLVEPGDYLLCGTLLWHDDDVSNNRICKTIHVIPLETFDVSVNQLSNGTIRLLVNASEILFFTLTKGKIELLNLTTSASSFALPFVPEKDGLYTFRFVGKNDKKEYSVFLHSPKQATSQTIDFRPQTIDHKPLTLNHKSLSFRDKSPTTINRPQALDQRYLFLSFLFFIPLFFAAVYVLIKK